MILNVDSIIVIQKQTVKNDLHISKKTKIMFNKEKYFGGWRVQVGREAESEVRHPSLVSCLLCRSYAKRIWIVYIKFYTKCIIQLLFEFLVPTSLIMNLSKLEDRLEIYKILQNQTVRGQCSTVTEGSFPKPTSWFRIHLGVNVFHDVRPESGFTQP